MKAKKLLIATLFTSVAAVAVGAFAFVPRLEAEKLKANGGAYTCASIHFGMKDADNTAVIYDCSGGTANLSGSYDATEGLISSISCETYTQSGNTKYTVFAGGAYSSDSPSGYSRYAIKIGVKDRKGSMTITFASNIIGATVYAVPYLSSANPAVHEKVTMVVNGQEVDLTEAAGGPSYNGKKTAKAVTFVPYQFSFAEPTNTLVLTSKEAKVDSVSASRYYVADIAVRVAA